MNDKVLVWDAKIIHLGLLSVEAHKINLYLKFSRQNTVLTYEFTLARSCVL